MANRERWPDQPGRRTSPQSAYLFHGKHAGRRTIGAIAAGLVVLIRQDFSTFECNQAAAVADHGRVADMDEGVRALCPDSVQAVEEYRSAIHDKGGKRGIREGNNAVAGITAHNAVAQLNNYSSGAAAHGSYASAVGVHHPNAVEHRIH